MKSCLTVQRCLCRMGSCCVWMGAVVLGGSFLGPPPAASGALVYIRRQTNISSDQAVAYRQAIGAAHIALQEKRYTEAIDNLQRALSISADDGTLYAYLGDARFALRHYDEAATSYGIAFARGFLERAEGAYRIAVCYALIGNRSAALHWLEKSLRARLKDRGKIARDTRFAVLHNDPRFNALSGALPDRRFTRDEGWTYDLNFLAAEVRRLDPAYSGGLPPDFVARMSRLKRLLPRLTDRQIAIQIMALFASLHQAHSVMFPFGMKRGTLFNLPLALYKFADGIVVTGAPFQYKDLIGGHIISVGGIGVETLTQAFLPYLSRDNDAFLALEVPIALTWTDLLVAVGANVRNDSVRIVVRHGSSLKTKTMQAVPIDPEQIPFKLFAPRNGQAPPEYLAHRNQNFWIESLPSAVLYVQINQFEDGPVETLAQFARRLTDAIVKERPHDLVLDVRLNNGGNYEASFPILKALFSFQIEHPDGALYVIIGRDTESAAQNFISTIDAFGNAIFVGEPSGSSPDHIGDDTLVVLPYSGITGSIACAVHQTNFRDLRPWIPPDVPVPLSSSDYFAQKDPAMAVIRLLIREHAEKPAKH